MIDGGYDVRIEETKITYKKWHWSNFDAGEGDVFNHQYDCINFDNFEDIIEVGDLLRKYDKEEDFEYLWYVEDIEKFYRSDRTKFEILEIYKHVGKDFIRVCRKENGEWVID